MERLFERLRSGDDSALGELTPTLYKELHRIASRHLSGERQGHTLQPTALVHEAYLKMVDGSSREYADRVHFLAVASRVMRQVLVDYARAKASLKRSAPEAGAAGRTTSLEVQAAEGLDMNELLALDAALDALAEENAELAQLIEFKYFGGLTAEETAEALGKSVHVVRHDLRFAQAWLREKLSR